MGFAVAFILESIYLLRLPFPQIGPITCRENKVVLQTDLIFTHALHPEVVDLFWTIAVQLILTWEVEFNVPRRIYYMPSLRKPDLKFSFNSYFANPMGQDSKIKSLVQNLYFQPLGLLKIVKNYHNELLLCQIPLYFKRTWCIIAVC